MSVTPSVSSPTPVRPPRLDEAVSRLRDEAYWRALDPSLPMSTAPVTARVDAPGLDTKLVPALSRMQREGYFVIPSVLPLSALEDVQVAMATVEAAGWPPVFSFLYDAPWILGRLNPVRRLAEAILGPGCPQLPDFWAYHVKPTQRGYRPHVEVGYDHMLLPDGSPISLTIWLPLTDATVYNGCMYVVPRHLAEEKMMVDDARKEYGEGQLAILRSTLHRARALPAPAGSLLTWHHLLLHWGSCTNERATHPRKSLAVEYVRADVDPATHPHAVLPKDAPSHSPITLDPDGPLPTFEQRVTLLAKNIRGYYGSRHDDDFQAVATHFLKLGYPA